VNNSQVINSYKIRIHRQDVLFSDSRESKTSPPPSNKRLATEAALQVAEVVRGPKRPRAIDNRPPCAFCSKPGHLAENCWVKMLNSRTKRGLTMLEDVTPPHPLYLSTTSPQPLFKPWSLMPWRTWLPPSKTLDNLSVCVTLARQWYPLVTLPLRLTWALLISLIRILKLSHIRVHSILHQIIWKQ